MPVYRGPDGKIIEEKTDKQSEDTKPPNAANRPLPPAPQGGEQPAGAGRLDAPTQRMGGSRAPANVGTEGTPSNVGAEGTPSNVGAEEQTRLVGGRRRQEDEERRQERAEEDRGMDDPVVGWLVIVEGPGKGRAVQLGYGSNALGRGTTDRVKLDFGDDQISRSGHAVVTYDPRGRKFYVQHGGGTNLTYLGDQPVLAPTELPALSHISIGNTVLRFVPLCGAEFDWQDTEGSQAQ